MIRRDKAVAKMNTLRTETETTSQLCLTLTKSSPKEFLRGFVTVEEKCIQRRERTGRNLLQGRCRLFYWLKNTCLNTFLTIHLPALSELVELGAHCYPFHGIL